MPFPLLQKSGQCELSCSDIDVGQWKEYPAIYLLQKCTQVSEFLIPPQGKGSGGNVTDFKISGFLIYISPNRSKQS